MLRCLNQFIIHAFIQSDCLMNIYHVQDSVLGTVKNNTIQIFSIKLIISQSSNYLNVFCFSPISSLNNFLYQNIL